MGDVVESIDIAADAADVYGVVSDVAGMGRFSPEATGARVRSERLQAGDRFLGLNRRGPVRWATTCTVTVADPGRAFEFLVDAGPLPVSRWRYDIEPVAGGVRVTETWTDRRTGPLGVAMKLLGQAVIPGSRPDHNRATMRATLQRMKAALEGVERS